MDFIMLYMLCMPWGVFLSLHFWGVGWGLCFLHIFLIPPPHTPHTTTPHHHPTPPPHTPTFFCFLLVVVIDACNIKYVIDACNIKYVMMSVSQAAAVGLWQNL